METGQTRYTLIQRLQSSDDENSWQDFSGTYRGYIYAIVQKMGLGHEDCEEVVQDILVRVWKGLKDFSYERNKCKFRTWLGTICRRTVLNFVDKKSYKQSAKSSSLDSEELAQKSFSEPEVEQIAEKEWQIFIAEKAWKAIQNQFNQKHLDIYRLYLEGKSAAETARKLELAENSVFIYRKRVQQAMKREILRLDHDLG